MWWRSFFCFCSLVMLPTSQAWSLTFESLTIDSETALIVVSGPFEAYEDFTPFFKVIDSLGRRSAIVTFDSPGGNPSKAIELGRIIRALKLPTLQTRSRICASACALAFIGGIVRGAEAGSIGVHKSSFADTSGMTVDGAVSYVQHQMAETIAYMLEMGVEPGLLQLSLRYEQDDIRFLSKSEMQEYRVTTFDLSKGLGTATAPSQPRNTTPSGTQAALPHSTSSSASRALPDYRIAPNDTRFRIPLAHSGMLYVPKGREHLRSAENQSSAKIVELKNGDPVEVLSVGERWYHVRVLGKVGYLHHNWVRVDQFVQRPFDHRFIQIKSFDNFAEAEYFVRNSDLPLTAYLATNNWFAIALAGTFPLERAKTLLDKLKTQQLVPNDAFVTVGNTYVNAVCCER